VKKIGEKLGAIEMQTRQVTERAACDFSSGFSRFISADTGFLGNVERACGPGRLGKAAHAFGPHQLQR